MTQQPEPQDQPEQLQSQSTKWEEPQPSAPPAEASTGADTGTGGTDALAEAAATLQDQLAERTADLQRLQAEYVNYKRRVDRDRSLVRDTATAAVLGALLPVLDDVDRARAHGELTGGFKAVSESLQRTVAALGLVRFGEAGEPFDPRVHEALTHELSDEVVGPTVMTILQPGYRVGDRIVRAARVAVAEPATTVAAPVLDEAEVPAGPGPVDADVAGPDVADDVPEQDDSTDESTRNGTDDDDRQ